MDPYTQSNLAQQAQYNQAMQQQTTYQQAPVQYPAASSNASNPQNAAAVAAYQQYQQQYYQQYHQMYAGYAQYPMNTPPSAAGPSSSYPIVRGQYSSSYPPATPQSGQPYAPYPTHPYPPYNVPPPPPPVVVPSGATVPVDGISPPPVGGPSSEYHQRPYRPQRSNGSPRFRNRPAPPPPPVAGGTAAYFPPPGGPDMMHDSSRGPDSRGMPMGMPPPPPDYHNIPPYRGGMRAGPRGMSDRGRGLSYRPDHRFSPRYRPGPRDEFRPYGPIDGRYDRRTELLPPPPARTDWRPPLMRDDFRPRGGGRGGYMDRKTTHDRERDPKRRRMEEPPPPARDSKSQTPLHQHTHVSSLDPAPPGVTESTREELKAPPTAVPPPTIGTTNANTTARTIAPRRSSTASSPITSTAGKVLGLDLESAVGNESEASSVDLTLTEQGKAEIEDSQVDDQDLDQQQYQQQENDTIEFKAETFIKGIPIDAYINPQMMTDPWEELELLTEHPAGFNPY